MNEKPGESLREWLSDIRAAISGPLLWLGVVVAITSGISAMTRLFGVGLSGIFGDFVRFYRGLLSPLYELVSWHFDVPELAVDLAAIYVVLVGMGIRSELSPKTIDFEVMNPGPANGKKGVIFHEFGESSLLEKAMLLVRSLALLPVLKLEPVVSWFERRPEAEVFGENPKETLRLVREVRRQNMLAFIAVPAAITIFFVLNAYVPAPH